ncbi:MAG TPA: aminotransferase class V-fold PLP-dependent enzyme [Solirubrobacterales bacterium]|nr:aminotransferase class V-fold PLP-dependent enzyme [Solirubrobacterales bacterium]
MYPPPGSESQPDWKALRAQTPGAEATVHLNAAGAALMAEPVLAGLTEQVELEARLGGYEAAERNAAAIADLYPAAAALLGCASDEIAFVENATRGWQLAFYSIPLSPADRILTSVAEYASNYIAFLQVARRTGARIEVVPNDERGQLSVAALAALLDEDVRVVAITHVPTNGGLVNPAAEVGALTRDSGAIFLLDACQSAGQLDLDVERIGCDLLSFTGRKYVRGPRGTGILYGRREVIEDLEPPLLDLRAASWQSQESYVIAPGARRFECWESSVAGRVGLARALRQVEAIGIGAIAARVGGLAERLRGMLAEVPGLTLRDLGREPCGIVTFTLAGHEAKTLREQLGRRGISVWHSGVESTRLDMQARGLDQVVRASLHYYNDEEDLDRLLAALEELA